MSPTQLLTIRQIDDRMEACYVAYCDAMDSGDLTTADAMYKTMDELLDARGHHLAER